MSKLSVIAKLTAAEGKESALESALADLIAASDEEPELEIYSVHKDTNDPGVYWFFEVYESSDSFATHGKGDRMKAAMAAVGGLLGGRPEVTVLSPVAAKGLDL